MYPVSKGCLKVWSLTPWGVLTTQASSGLSIVLRTLAPSLSLDRLMWAKIGPVGAVVAFAILIAIVCYITQTRRK